VAKAIELLTILSTSTFLTSLQTSDFSLLTSQNSPIIVKLVEPPRDPTGLASVLIGALGLAGAITLVAVIFGVLTAAIILWVRSRRSA
jgi:ABC-type phosphate transport system permease subunit